MKRLQIPMLLAGVAMLAACSSTPKQPIEELETARVIVPQVEASPRAGVAAENISNARKSLGTANQLMESGGKLPDIRYQALLATRNAQIANEKILLAQAKDEFTQAEAERQKVLLQARNREVEAARLKAQSLEQELKDLQAKKTERGLVLTLGDVLFDTGKSSLKPGAYATIERLAQALNENPARQVQIEGHTDSTGSADFNQALSEDRARSVQAALMQRGVSGSQITALGKGKDFPIASNDTAAGRQQNRRVELIFTENRAGTAPAASQ